MNNTNEMELKFDSVAENEGFARVAVGAFFTQLDPTLEEVCDVKTAVSEAVTNSIIHGYNEAVYKVEVHCRIDKEARQIEIEVIDSGVGMADVHQAMQPMYTTKEDCERAGMGFAFMEAFMDSVEVESNVGCGTIVKMRKTVRKDEEEEGYGSDNRFN